MDKFTEDLCTCLTGTVQNARGIKILYDIHNLKKWPSEFTEKPWSHSSGECGGDCR